MLDFIKMTKNWYLKETTESQESHQVGGGIFNTSFANLMITTIKNKLFPYTSQFMLTVKKSVH